MGVVLLIGDGGGVTPCWEPRPGVYVACSTHTAEQAAAEYPADYSDIRPWTTEDAEHWRRTGYPLPRNQE